MWGRELQEPVNGLPCPDSAQFSQDLHGGPSVLSRANAPPNQMLPWELQTSRWNGLISQEDAGGTPSPPGTSPRAHVLQQQQQQRGLGSVGNIHGYVAQMSLGQLNGAGRRPTSPAFLGSPLNDIDQQGRSRPAMMRPFPQSSFPPARGEGSGRNNGRFDPARLPLGHDKLALAETLATRVYSDLLAGFKGVSTGKVAQATLSALGVPSFETVGVMPQEIPCLRKLAQLESKVNAFVHTHVAAKKITTLYDLCGDLTYDEGVEEFEDLGLGPLLCHPLVCHYFSPSVGVEVHKITAREVIQHLSDYIDNLGQDTRVQIENFLAYVAKERSLSTPEHLCIRIQSLGMHIGFIRRSKKAEKELISTWENRAKVEFVKKEKPSVIERVTSFLAAERKNDAAFGKRKFACFSSNANSGTDDESEDGDPVEGATKRVVGVQNNTPRRKVKLKDTSSMALPITATTCPYPSAAQERVRLKKQELLQFVAKSEQEDFGLSTAELQEFMAILRDACENRSVHEALMKMIEMCRKFKGSKKSKHFKTYPAIGLLNVAVLSVKAGHWDSTYKKQELLQFVAKSDQVVAKSDQGDFGLSTAELQEFMAILKDTCENRSVHEALMKMIEMSWKFKGTKNRSGRPKQFKAYPAIGLLNVAVLSVKAGHWDSTYKNFLDAAAETGGSLKDQFRSVQIAAPINVDSNSRQSVPCEASELPAGPKEIVAAVREHYEQYLRPRIIEEDLDTDQNKHRSWWIFLHWVCECEIWIAGKYSVGAFVSLGVGKFSYFLEQYLEALPSWIVSILGEKSRSRRLVPKIPKERVFSFLSQALPMLHEGLPLSQDHILGLLYRQFKVSSVEDLGANSLESLLKMSKDEKSGLAPICHVFFLEPLIAASAMEKMSGLQQLKENRPEGEIPGAIYEKGVGVLGSMTSVDAAQCLLKAPFLADLSEWSQWHAVFAPTLGALLDWFEREGCKSGLHAVVTCEGSLLRIDGTATAENFLLATARGCAHEMAAVLMSLIALYGGIANTPTELLKSHASKGLEIFLGSSGGDWTLQSSSIPPVVNSKRKFTEYSGGQVVKPSSRYRDGKPKLSAKPAAPGSGKLQVKDNYDKRIHLPSSAASQCVMECLSCVIPELRIFTAEILLPALLRLIASTPAALLSSCFTLQQKSILHAVGLSLGIPEWTSDYKSSVFGSIQLSVPLRMSDPDGTEVNKPSQPKPETEMSDELINCNRGGSMVHTVIGGSKNGFEDTEILPNHLPYTCEADRCGRSPQLICFDSANMMQRTSGKGHEEGESEGMLGEKALLDAQANTVIEEIRRYEFGLGQDISGKEHDLLARQHARMGRALHRLSSDLYSQDSHFVLELVQNADDNAYNPGVEAALVFLIQEARIVVLNNETGFTAANIRALCDVGNSTKAETNTGYIGHKGIGFKSVFRVTNAPEIHSNGFHFKFDISKGDLGFILPTCIPPPAGDCGDDVVSLMSEVEMPKSVVECWNTRINLPIKESLHSGTGMSTLISKFADLHPSLLLFLHRLRCIVVHNDLIGSTVVMHREDCGEDLIRVVHETGTTTWMVVRHQVKAAVHRPGIADTVIALAFQLNELSVGIYEACSEQQQVFAFLPLRAYGLRFIVQGDFKVPSSREEVDCDSDWNQWLRSEIPNVFMKSAKAFHRTIGSGNAGKAVSSFMKFVPMEGEVLGFFSPLPRMILSALRGSPCLPVEGGGWALPCVLLRGWSASTRQLLPDRFLNDHLGLCYLDKDVIIPDILALKLGVQQFGAGTLVAVMKSVCQKNVALPSHLKWVQAWLLALHHCFEPDQQSYQPGMYVDRLGSFSLELQNIPYIPLSNGLFTSLSDGPVWFAGELLDNGLGVCSVLSKFVLLSSELRTVHPALLSLQYDSATSEESAEAATVLLCSMLPITKSLDNVVSILQRLGVSRLSEHEVLKSHVLPSMVKDDCFLKDKLLLVEYLGFAILHMESNCATCSSEKFDVKAHLQRCAVILTSNGLIRARQQPIHFGSEMGNTSLDMGKILEGTSVPWIEVSPLYVDLQASGCNLMKWRAFFKELGVTDFVEVVYSEKILLDKTASIWKACEWEEEAASERSWIVQDWHSPELAQLLLNVNTYAHNSAVTEEQILSSHLKERCTSILVALDCGWDDYYYQFCKASYSASTAEVRGPQKATVSSFLLLLQQCLWVISSLDEKLHVPTDLFRSCDAVESILGSHAPYVATPIHSDSLMEALGFRTQVLMDDALQLLHYWSNAKGLFEASVAQMTKLYLFLWEQFATHKQNVLSAFRSRAAIFVPLHWKENHKEVQKGVFYPVGKVCWKDPTKTLDLVAFNQDARLHHLVMPLASIYQGLHAFFVGECLVQEKPSFDGYLEVVRKVAAEQSPSAVLSHVMEVFCLWSSEITAGNVESSEILRWKRRLEEVESCVFATCEDKWVSLNLQSGLVCICDDENLGEEFKESLGHIHFILMKDDDLTKVCKWSSYQKTNKGTLQPLIQALRIPKLSEVVKREVVKYGLHDNSKIAALVEWVLPYVQRYLKQHHVDQYGCLQRVGMTETLRRLQFVVVDQLYFQYSLRNSAIRSSKRSQCTCILEDGTLYVVEDFVDDYCNIYIELSRFFFCGKSNLSVANFLHLITLMVSSGSAQNEVEGFIQNVQGIRPITGEDPWTLCAKVGDHPDGPSESERLSVCYLERHVNQQNLRKKGTNGTVTGGWPPDTWKPFLGVKESPTKVGQLGIKEGILNLCDSSLQVDPTRGYPSTVGILPTSAGEIVQCSDLKDNSFWDGARQSTAMDCDAKHIFVGEACNVSSQHRPSFTVSMGEKSGRAKVCHQEKQRESLQHCTGSATETRSSATDVLEVMIEDFDSVVDETMHEAGTTINFEGRDFLVSHSRNQEQRESTGRLGEELVFQYLCRQYGLAHVKWLNQKEESGAAYDIVVIKDSGQTEFVEVKATRSGDKDWFEISTREWDFARTHAESFTIMRVFFSLTNKHIKMMRMPNPVKLAQDRVLQLALLLPTPRT